jgi:hypothetical protein
MNTVKELGIAFPAYSLLHHGWLVDVFPHKSLGELADDDARKTRQYHALHLVPG